MVSEKWDSVLADCESVIEDCCRAYDHQDYDLTMEGLAILQELLQTWINRAIELGRVLEERGYNAKYPPLIHFYHSLMECHNRGSSLFHDVQHAKGYN